MRAAPRNRCEGWAPRRQRNPRRLAERSSPAGSYHFPDTCKHRSRNRCPASVLLSDCPLPTPCCGPPNSKLKMATCRHKANSGGFSGSVDDQVDILIRAAEAGAQIVDLEIESAEPAKKRLPDIRRKAALVISYHNFESTPALAGV